MIPARYRIEAHAQDFLAHDELLLPILKAFAQCTPYSKCFMFSVFVTVAQSLASTSCSPVVHPVTSSPPHRARPLPLRGDHLVPCGLYAFLISFALSTPCLCSPRSGLLVQLKITNCGLQPNVTSHCRSTYLPRHPDVRCSQSVFHQM